jgi:hypothetical protein
MEIVSLFASEGISVDVFTGRVSAYNIIEGIYAPKYPAKLMRVHLVVQYQRSKDEPVPHFFEQLSIIAPSGTDVLRGPIQEVTVFERHHTTLHTAWAMDIPEAGDYLLKVRHSQSSEGPWTDVRSRTILVATAPHPLMR